MTNLKRKRLTSIFQYLFFLGFGILLLWLSFRKLDLSDVWNDVRKADYIWLLLSLMVALVSHFFRALRWNLLINNLGYKTRISSTFFAVMVGYMANTAVPRMGEFMRCGVLSRKEKIPFNGLFGTVISERLFDLIVLLLIIFGVIAFQFSLVKGMLEKLFGGLFTQQSETPYVLLMTVAIVVAFTGLLVALYRFRKSLMKIGLFRKIASFMNGLGDGIKTIVRLDNKLLFVFYTFMIWVSYAGMIYLPLFMLPATSHLTFIDALTIMSIGSLGIVAPVPGGLGTYHFIVKAILYELYHVDPVSSGTFAALTHAGQTLLNVIVGAFGYFYITILSKKQKPVNEKS